MARLELATHWSLTDNPNAPTRITLMCFLKADKGDEAGCFLSAFNHSATPDDEYRLMEGFEPPAAFPPQTLFRR
jgi:hypothetical protein